MNVGDLIPVTYPAERLFLLKPYEGAEIGPASPIGHHQPLGHTAHLSRPAIMEKSAEIGSTSKADTGRSAATTELGLRHTQAQQDAHPH